MTRNRRLLVRCLFFLYLAAVLFLCFGHFDSTEDVPRMLLGIPTDKLVHFCMFFPFPFLAFLSFDRYTRTVRSSLLHVGITLALGLLLAVGTEWGQAQLTDYRSGDRWDLLADSIALLTASLTVLFLDIHKQKR